jgi:hypothetical protein
MNSRQEKGTASASATIRIDPHELYARCDVQERELELTFQQNRQAVLEFLAFGTPLFDPNPGLDAAIRKEDPLELKIDKLRRRADKYESLIQLLKNAKDKEVRLVVLAIWLKHEGVCGPREFLPPAAYRRALLIARQARIEADLSFTDLLHSRRVRTWLPYFEQLLSNVRGLKGNPRVRQKLEGLGYKRETIEIVLGARKRSAVSACCEWLECQGKGQARTIENAYSRYRAAAQFVTNRVPSAL